MSDCGHDVVSRETRPTSPLKSLAFTLSLIALSTTGCGYRPAYVSRAPARFSVVSGPFAAPHPEAVEAALAGMRAGLSQADALTTGAGYPQVVLQILRVDELAAGIAAELGPSESALARGSAIGVVGRAWILEGPRGQPTNDTGDLRRVEYVAQSSEPLTSSYAYGSAVRAAGRRLGEALARRILGGPEPGTDPM